MIQHLNEKIKELQSLIGEEYFDFSDFYIAGGCIYSIWNDKEPKDYDIFCQNKNAIKKLFKFFRTHKDLADATTKNAISMGKYQFVVKHIGKPNVEVAKFDFFHNCYWYDIDGLHNIKGWEYLDSNKLEFNSARARDILNILTRVPKFVSRGMEISQFEILDILELGTRPTKIFSERRGIKRRRSGKSRY